MPISLNALTDAHVPAVVAACADWRELAAFGAPYWRPRSDAELRRKVAATAGPALATDYNFVLADDGRLVGECSVHGIDWRNRVAQIGVCVWSPADRRSGYGRYGVEQMITYGFDYLGLSRLEAWVLAGNDASAELFTGFGFEHEGTLQARYLEGGKRRDMEIYGLVAPSI